MARFRFGLLACRFGLLVLLCQVVLVGRAGPVAASTLDVCPNGCPYTTVQQALAAASDGDIIAIAPGTYPGGLTIGKDVTLVGAGPDQTTLLGVAGSLYTAIIVDATATTAIESLTVDVGLPGPVDPLRMGVSNYGTLTMQDVVVTDATNNWALANIGGTLFLDHATITNNYTDGLFNYHAGLSTIGTATVSHSTIESSGGVVNGDVMTIDRSTITGNGGAFAGGIWNFGAGDLTIEATTISGNSGEAVGGIRNGVDYENGAISTLTLYRVTIKSNSGGEGGIWNGIYGVAALHHSRVTRNIGRDHGGIFNQGALTLDHTRVSQNVPDDCVGC